MISPFIVNADGVYDKNLFLDRFPVGQVNRALVAWDASDEYLINYVIEQNLADSQHSLLIYNDNFGAITANFTQSNVTTVSDSWISKQGLQYNIEQNGLSLDNITQLSSLDSLPENITVVLYKIPKSKSLMIDQLLAIKSKYNQKLIFIAADKAKDIHSSTLKLFEKYLGTTKTSLAVKKSRLVFSQLDNEQVLSSPFPTVWPLESTPFIISNHSGVYAREKLDIGARHFMKNLPEVKSGMRVIDLGCGNGVIGLTVLAQQPEAMVTFVDESYMAVDSAKENISKNLPDLFQQCEFTINDCLADVEPNSVDLVLCNPPFHQQNATTDHIAWQMFRDSHRVLKKGGELRIIGNRQLGYHIKLKRLFGNEKIIASNDKFVTLSAIK
ncbi:MAG: methyltransferase [Colwellia sp.]|nr:methyltransferase [Colwellia sp.]